ncbi:hypothetical protein MASSI9I_51438 [Massilia sp. 9I]|nr:hypothetical protein MASSI9I_51438 [Massilia sp. 9I]
MYSVSRCQLSTQAASTIMSSPIVLTPQEIEAVSKPAQASTADLSRNFSFAKVLAILTVTTGHWFTGTILWIPGQAPDRLSALVFRERPIRRRAR